jgi:rhomboid protease GluP
MNPDQSSPQGSLYQPEAPTGQMPMRPVFRPYVTYTLIVICVVVYLLQLATRYLLVGVDVPALWGAKVNSLIIQGQIWRLITPVFLHSSDLPFGIFHIGFNMYALFILGRDVEIIYKHKRFLALFLLSGFTGNVMSFVFSPYPSIGASTAIFGLIGAEGVLIYQNREIFGSFTRRALSQIIFIAALNLAISLAPGIDIWGHIGGLIGGTLFAWFGGPLLRRTGLVQPFSVENVRTTREVIVAGTAVFALFFFLTIAVIFINKG